MFFLSFTCYLVLHGAQVESQKTDSRNEILLPYAAVALLVRSLLDFLVMKL